MAGSTRSGCSAARSHCAAARSKPDRTHGRDTDQGNGHRFSYRREPGLLHAVAELCAGAAAAGLFRADQLAPYRPARAGPRQRRPASNEHTLAHRRGFPGYGSSRCSSAARPTARVHSQPLAPYPFAPLFSAPKAFLNLTILMLASEHPRPISQTFQPPEGVGGGLRIPNGDSKSRPLRRLRLPEICVRGTGRRDERRVLLRVARHRPYNALAMSGCVEY